MTGTSRPIAAAAAGLLLLGTSALSQAQTPTTMSVQPVSRIAAVASGSIQGVVRDETGEPVAGAMVSAVGAATTFAVTDRAGRFELATLSPGPYLVRAHLSGYIAPRAQMLDVRPSVRSASWISMRRSASTPVLAAGVGPAFVSDDTAATPVKPDVTATETSAPADSTEPDQGETAWRIRHARRGVLKDATIPEELIADDDGIPSSGPLTPADFLSRAAGSSMRLATSFFTATPFSGQVNLLTSGSFESPQQLFSSDGLGNRIAYAHVGAPVGLHADWTVRGALTQADLSSWIIAGSYTTRAPARHQYDVGLSYATQRYDGGNPLALRDVTDGSRNAGTVYGFDTFTITPALAVTYGGSYARYDYLDHRGLISPRVEVSLKPAEHLRFNARVARQATAPGAEEFLPPGDNGIWLPPQRTFSSIVPGVPMDAERATRVAVEVERDIAAATVSVRAFHQHVDDQLVTLFGADMPNQPAAKVGHYVVGNAGDADASGCAAELRTMLSRWVRGSVEYSMATARIEPAGDLRYLVLLAPSAMRASPERIHNITTSIETDVPETSTRVLVLYRVSNAFAAADATGSAGGLGRRPGYDSRFDVQVRQSLPFMDFTSAKWEMLLAVRNFFRETSPDQSVYDELLVVRPPKRIVGGLTLHF